MKRKYIIPVITMMTINVEHHLMDLSSNGSSSISSREADSDAFVKGNSSNSSYNVWNDDWSE